MLTSPKRPGAKFGFVCSAVGVGGGRPSIDKVVLLFPGVYSLPIFCKFRPSCSNSSALYEM